MTIRIPTPDEQTTLSAFGAAVYRALQTAGCPDLAEHATWLLRQSRDVQEYLQAVLALSDELTVEWQDAPRKGT